MSRQRYFSTKKSFTTAEELSEQGKVRYEQEMNDKEKADFKNRYYDYENQPNLSRLLSAAKRNDLLFVHMNTTGVKALGNEITQFGAVHLAYDEKKDNYFVKDSLDVTMAVSEERMAQLQKEIDSGKFNVLEYAGIHTEDYFKGVGVLDKAVALREIDKFLTPFANDLSVIKVGYNDTFVNDFCKKEQINLRVNVDLCDIANEYNGARIKNEETPLFTGKANIRNIAEQMGLPNQNAFDIASAEAHLVLNIFQKELTFGHVTDKEGTKEEETDCAMKRTLDRSSKGERKTNLSSLFGVEKPAPEMRNQKAEREEEVYQGKFVREGHMRQETGYEPSFFAQSFEKATGDFMKMLGEKADLFIEMYERQMQQRNEILSTFEKILFAQGERISQLEHILTNQLPENPNHTEWGQEQDEVEHGV